MGNCGDVKAFGVPGWKGEPSKSWDGRRGVNCILSYPVPGDEIPLSWSCEAPVLIEGMFMRRRFGWFSVSELNPAGILT